MGWWDDETGAEGAAKINGQNQAANHARREAAKEQDRERKRQEQWESENRRYQRAEYEADLAAWKKKPTEYERLYTSPYDVPDMPGDPSFDMLREKYQRKQAEKQQKAQSEERAAFAKIGLVVLAVIFVLPALLQVIMPTVGHVLQIVWLTVLSLAGVLTAVWLVLKLSAGDDPQKIHRPSLQSDSCQRDWLPVQRCREGDHRACPAA